MLREGVIEGGALGGADELELVRVSAVDKGLEFPGTDDGNLLAD